MENTSKFTRVFDKGKGKFVFKPSDETPETNYCCTYGNYVKCEEEKIEKAKDLLLEQLIDTIRELAEKDEFWIIKKVNGLCTVGWKVEFPQMLPKENHINDAAFKDIIFCDALDAHKK